MIDLDFLQSLIRAIDESSLDSIEIERGGTKVRLSKSPQGQVVQGAPAPAPAAAPPGPAAPAAPAASGGDAAVSGDAASAAGQARSADDGLVEVTSPMVGTFYRSPGPDAPPYVERGDHIAVGDTLCIIEAMKLMNELEAEVAGEVVEVLVENAEPVEYGQVLFKVRP